MFHNRGEYTVVVEEHRRLSCAKQSFDLAEVVSCGWEVRTGNRCHRLHAELAEVRHHERGARGGQFFRLISAIDADDDAKPTGLSGFNARLGVFDDRGIGGFGADPRCGFEKDSGVGFARYAEFVRNEAIDPHGEQVQEVGCAQDLIDIAT